MLASITCTVWGATSLRPFVLGCHDLREPDIRYAHQEEAYLPKCLSNNLTQPTLRQNIFNHVWNHGKTKAQSFCVFLSHLFVKSPQRKRQSTKMGRREIKFELLTSKVLTHYQIVCTNRPWCSKISSTLYPRGQYPILPSGKYQGGETKTLKSS